MPVYPKSLIHKATKTFTFNNITLLHEIKLLFFSISGGPLFDGDIEDYNGRCHVMCPWHSYMFDLETGQNEIGLRVRIFYL